MKHLLTSALIQQMCSLSVEQVQACIKGGGSDAVIDSVEFMGMTGHAHFVYRCTGKDLEPWIKEFRVKFWYDPKWAERFKPEFQAEARKRQLGDFFIGWA